MATCGKQNKLLSKIDYIIRDVYRVWSGNGQGKIDFTIRESNGSSRVQNKKIIHLLIWNGDKKRYYDENTIIAVAIHELAHILSSEYDTESHSQKFNELEEKLLDIATSLGYYNPRLSPDPDYPCVSH
jgi:hypothetical protein